jgi:hypothetical protein
MSINAGLDLELHMPAASAGMWEWFHIGVRIMTIQSL